jgi:hypothetical protein
MGGINNQNGGIIMDPSQKKKEYLRTYYAKKKAADPDWYDNRLKKTRVWNKDNPEIKRDLQLKFRKERRDNPRSGETLRKSPATKLTEKQVIKIKKQLALGKTFGEIAGVFEVTNSVISDIFYEYTWRHVPVREFRTFKVALKANNPTVTNRGKPGKRQTLPEIMVKSIRTMGKKDTGYFIAKKLGINTSTVYSILGNKIYKKVSYGKRTK